ncbi:MAG: type II toxin-antitoxin system RelE/ParE family toxin [Gammaproteobacteria bacterium]
MDILEYMAADGRVPFREWLKDLRDRSARARIRIRLDRVRLGNLGDYRALSNGLYELRIAYGPGYRVYFALLDRSVVLLLTGADKGSQRSDIDTARTYWNDFRAQHHG